MQLFTGCNRHLVLITLKSLCPAQPNTTHSNYFYTMAMQLSTSKLITIVAHTLVWVVFGIAIFFYHPLFSGIDIPLQAWVTQAITLVLLVVAFYVNAIILVPRFLLKNQLVYYVALLIGIIAAIAAIMAWVDLALTPAQALNPVQGLLPRAMPLKPGGPAYHIQRPVVIITALVLGIGTSITAIQKMQKDRQKREELEKDKVTSELLFLKAQVNPHFFFNTLNNIYALTAVDGELAGKAIHQLSRMMRYLLYDTQAGHTTLSQEIAFVKDYISLMQLRLTDAVKITFNTPPGLQDVPLAPMMFLPFVENAFKHGVQSAQPGYINITVTQQRNMLQLTVSNSVIHNNSSISLDVNSGIGLVNTRRRLDLLYPGKYRLDIHCQANEYTVNLALNLL